MNHAIIQGLAAAVPETCYRQTDILDILRPYLSGNPHTETIFAHAGIDSRYLLVSGAFYEQERTTQERNERYMEAALPLGALAIQRCLAQAGLTPAQVDDLIVVSCTGIDIPGLDLRLAGQLGMSPALRRTCVLGMGCYGAFPGLQRARDAALARPGSRALVVAVELCSLHFQPDDDSIENVVSSALFADGAAAALVSTGPQAGPGPMLVSTGPQAGPGPKLVSIGPQASPGPMLVDSATYCDYQTFDDMAFHLTDHGFKMSLSAYVPRLLAAKIEDFVGGMLAKNGLTLADVGHWGVHPGSSKILDYVAERLSLPADALDASRRVLRQYGNMSSATILFVLDELQRLRRPAPGEWGVLLSFGPGLTMEGALVQW